MTLKAHQFEVASFSKPTFCDFCGEFIWGVSKQGAECIGMGNLFHLHYLYYFNLFLLIILISYLDCQYHVHKRCLKRVGTICLGSTKNNNSINEHGFHFRSSIDESDTMAPSRASKSIDSKLDANNISTGTIVQELMGSTALHSKQLAKEREAASPPLNLLTRTPKNMTRFVSRVGPMRQAEGFVLDLFMWKDPVQSTLALFVYTLFCLYPYLLLVLPQIIVTIVVVKCYYSKAEKTMKCKKKNGATVADSLHPNAQVSTSSTTTTSVKLPSSPSDYNGPSLSVNDYTNNLQWIQNFVGNYADMYDIISQQAYLVNWSDEKRTWEVLKITWISLTTVLIVTYFMPLRFLALFGGIGAFLSNTAFARAAKETLVPVILYQIQITIDHVYHFMNELWSGFLEGVTEMREGVVNMGKSISNGNLRGRHYSDSSDMPLLDGSGIRKRTEEVMLYTKYAVIEENEEMSNGKDNGNEKANGIVKLKYLPSQLASKAKVN